MRPTLSSFIINACHCVSLFLIIIFLDFWITPLKYRNMFSVHPRGKFGPHNLHCFNPKAIQTVESFQGLSEKFTYRSSLKSVDFPLGLHPSGKSNDSSEFPWANLSRPPLQTFYYLYQLSKITTLDSLTQLSKYSDNYFYTLQESFVQFFLLT